AEHGEAAGAAAAQGAAAEQGAAEHGAAAHGAAELAMGAGLAAGALLVVTWSAAMAPVAAMRAAPNSRVLRVLMCV
ncbi:MAG TPA: hypothetical protein VL068_04740, partial [Microthrixaceae bacterium]|nr:hypothetical protein [Microthrixaceae bacterium]